MYLITINLQMESEVPNKERTSPATPVGGSRRPSSGSGSGGRKRGHRRARKNWRAQEDRQHLNRGRSRRGSGGGGGRHQNLLNRLESHPFGQPTVNTDYFLP